MINVGASIHNRFDIEVRDSITGELKQTARAFNIVCTTMWTRLTARSVYFVNILFGTGSGTPAIGDTALFTYLGTKVATDVELVKALPTSSWKRSIRLEPEEYVGSILSEVGIAYGALSTNLVTHAMLEDEVGNPTTLLKTATDVVMIYATVFVTLSTGTDISICSLPSNNPLINYLIGGATFSNQSFYAGESAIEGSESVNTIVARNAIGSITAGTWTADVANKRTSSAVARLSVSNGNGHIREFGVGASNTAGIARVVLPYAGYSGLELADVSVGVGDGTTRRFILPSRSIRQSTVVMKKDGVATTAFTKEETNANTGLVPGYVIAYPTTLPGSTGRGCDITPDGLVLAVAHSITPYIIIYDWTGGSWVKRANPAILPTDIGNDCALSSDGLILAVAHYIAPYITTYDWTGGAWVKRTDPAVLPTGIAYGCTLSSDGLILAVAHYSTPYITTYDWTGGAWVKRANPAVLPIGTAYDCALSSDGLVLAVAHYTTPYISIYDWTGGAWVKRANPAVLPTGTAYGCALSSDGLILAVAHTTSPSITIYDWTGGA